MIVVTEKRRFYFFFSRGEFSKFIKGCFLPCFSSNSPFIFSSYYKSLACTCPPPPAKYLRTTHRTQRPLTQRASVTFTFISQYVYLYSKNYHLANSHTETYTNSKHHSSTEWTYCLAFCGDDTTNISGVFIPRGKFSSYYIRSKFPY